MPDTELTEAIRTHAGRARMNLISQVPHLARVITEARHEAKEDNPALIACTNGRTIYYGPLFLKERTPQRDFIVLHEVLHQALGHPWTARMAQAWGRTLDHELHNWACDAVINELLDAWGPGNIQCPEKAIRWKVLQKEALACLSPERAKEAKEFGIQCKDQWFIPPEFFHSPDCRFSSMEIHDHLLHLRQESGKNPGETLRRKRRKPCASDPGGHGGCIQPSESPEENPSLDEMEDEIRRRGESLRNAIRQSLDPIHGKRPGSGALEILAAQAPKPRWFLRLRRWLDRKTSAQAATDPRRVSQECINLHAAGLPHLLSPAMTARKKGGCLAICVDTSGSITDEDLREFMMQSLAVVNSRQVPVHIITCDAEVQEVHENASEKLRREVARNGGRLRVGGRGGTSFIPAIEKAMSLKPKPAALAYLTDGWGPFPEDPGIPTLWVVSPKGAADEVFPFGSVLRIEAGQSPSRPL